MNRKQLLIILGFALVALALATIELLIVLGSPHYKTGDLNHDGHVNNDDATIMYANWDDNKTVKNNTKLELNSKPDTTYGTVNDVYYFQPANTTMQDTIYGEELQ